MTNNYPGLNSAVLGLYQVCIGYSQCGERR